MIYTNRGFWDTYMPASFMKEFNEYLLWVADYGWFNDGQWPSNPEDFPRVPDIWQGQKLDGTAPSIVQYGDKIVLPDMSGVASATIDGDMMTESLYNIMRVRSGIPEPNATVPGPTPDPTPEPEPQPDPEPVTEPEAPEGMELVEVSYTYRMNGE